MLDKLILLANQNDEISIKINKFLADANEYVYEVQKSSIDRIFGNKNFNNQDELMKSIKQEIMEINNYETIFDGNIDNIDEVRDFISDIVYAMFGNQVHNFKQKK